MFLTKLRFACGVLALFTLAALGLSTAATPSDKPAAPPDKSAKKAPAPPAAPEPKMPAPRPPELSVAEFVDHGPAPQSDRDALHGLWVLEKVDAGKGRGAEEARDAAGKMQFLIAGDVWWGMAP